MDVILKKKHRKVLAEMLESARQRWTPKPTPTPPPAFRVAGWTVMLSFYQGTCDDPHGKHFSFRWADPSRSPTAQDKQRVQAVREALMPPTSRNITHLAPGVAKLLGFNEVLAEHWRWDVSYDRLN